MMRRRYAEGMSLFEVMIAVAILGILVGTSYLVLWTSIKGDEALRVRMDLQAEAVRTLREVTELLKRSGPIDLNNDKVIGNMPGEYPLIYNDTTLLTGYYAFLNNPAITQPPGLTAEQGLGVSHEIAFRLPKDVDGLANRGPTSVATGAIEWGTDYYAIVLVPGTDGNELQFRRYDAAFALVQKRVIGKKVERILFHTTATEPQPVVAPQRPLGQNQIRVTAWFRRLNPDNKTPVFLQQISTANLRSLGN